MLIRIAVADENAEYVKRMLTVLEEYENLRLFVYTKKLALEEALKEKHFDVLLLDPSVYDGQAEIGNVSLAVVLLDETEDLPEGLRAFRKIHKYQRISQIYRQILELYAEVCKDQGDVAGQGRTTAIAFYSPAGGVGKTTLALTMAAKLALRGHRAFYLNLEDMASEDCYLPQNADKGLSEIASYLEKNIHFSMKVQGLLQNKMENLYYLNHFDSPNDLCEMTESELGELLEQLEKTGLFDYMIVDMGTALNGKTRQVFEIADRIVVVERDDAMAQKKLESFFSQAHIMNEYGGKMSRVLNFDRSRKSRICCEVPFAGKINAVQNPDAAQLITALAGDAGSGFLLQIAGV